MPELIKTPETPTACSLCKASAIHFYHRDKRREYFQCSRCQLVFTPERYFLDSASEKAEYEQHENNPEDAGYRRFLNRLCEPLSTKLPTAAQGLDFGCGPGPTLALMMKERGFAMQNYDPFFAPDSRLLERQYDFICATEVVEHLHQPKAVMELLFKLLKPNGYLGIMTKRVIDVQAFSRWHYKNDPTHVCFFEERTFEWLAQQHRAHLTIVGDDVVIFQKLSDS